MRHIVYATLLIIAVGAGYSIKPMTARLSATAPRPAFTLPTVTVNGQPAWFYAAPAKAPLVVNLHEWSGTEATDSGSDGRFDQAVVAKGWNFIRPLIGPNSSPDGCCSEKAMQTVREAIQYAKDHAPVDGHVFVVGASGGGYATLCSYMIGQLDSTAYIAWAPITDLAAWYNQTRGTKYHDEIKQCTSGLSETGARSPLTMSDTNRSKAPLRIFAGINDGSFNGGSVQFSHALRFYNRFASSKIGADEIEAMAEHRSGPNTEAGTTIEGRAVHLARTENGVSVTVFEGGHEFLVKETMRELEHFVASDKSHTR